MIKIINKTGISNNKELKMELINIIRESEYFGGKSKNYYKTEYNYNFSNNGNTWQRTTIEFRKCKKVWIVE